MKIIRKIITFFKRRRTGFHPSCIIYLTQPESSPKIESTIVHFDNDGFTINHRIVPRERDSNG